MKHAEHSLPAGCAYRIVRRLGSGGEGTVYLVCHLPTEQFRAAKVITDVDRDCRHELNMLKRLHHPSLPQIIDVLEQPGQFWLIMEYIEGQQLDRFAGRFTEEELFRIAEQLSGALQYLHSRREPVFHLDIKPSNILLKPDGSLVLIDFGASIRGRPDFGQYQGYGTKGFAAPEQMQKDAVIDGRTDLYGFGAVLYYCRYRAAPVPGWSEMDSKAFQTFIFSNFPFIGRKQNKTETGSGGRRRSGAGKRGGVQRFPPGLERIVCRCLRTDPSGRFSDGAQLYAEVCRAHRFFRRRKQLVQLAGASVLLFFTLFYFFLMDLAGSGAAKSDNQSERAAPREEIHSGAQYASLLDRADEAGWTQALVWYEQAADLCPGDVSWYLRVICRMEKDSLFDAQEEEAFRQLMFAAEEDGVTRLDYLRQDPEGYGQMAWQLGLAYWYFYENSGGKNAAARWFAQAVSVLEEENLQTDWAEDARIHAKISSYYETDKSADEEGERQQKEWDYWKDLKELWMLPAKERDSRIGRRIAEELLEQIILHAALLRDCGETREGFDEVLSGLRDALSEDLEDAAAQEVLEELRELCDEAEAAMRRTFGGES